jgi:hypothetical protein
MSGKSRVVIFLLLTAVFVVALIMAWPSLGNGAGTAAAVGLLFGVVIGLRRVRENRDDPPGGHRGGRVDHALPKKWQRWIFKED